MAHVNRRWGWRDALDKVGCLQKPGVWQEGRPALGQDAAWAAPGSGALPTGGPLILQQMVYSASLRWGQLLAARVGRWQDTGDCLPGSTAGNLLSSSTCTQGSSQVPAAVGLATC